MPTLSYTGTAIRGWLYTILAADSTLNTAVGGRIYANAMPSHVTTYPCVVYRELSPGEELLGNAGARVLRAPVYLVEAIDEVAEYVSSESTLNAIADRIINVLHYAKGGHDDVTIISCTLEREFFLPELDEDTGKRYLRLGGEFRIEAQTAGS